MDDNDNFKFFKDAFNEFAKKYDKDDMASRMLRSIAAGGKATVDRGLQEFPKTFVSQLAKDIYGLITSQEIADGISSNVRAFDEEKVQSLLNDILAPLKDPATAVEIVKQMKLMTTDPEAAIAQMEESMKDLPEAQKQIFKMLLNKMKPELEQIKDMSLNDFIDQIEGLVSMIPGAGAMAPILFMQIRPILNGMKDASDEEIAQSIVELVEMIPTDMIAGMVASQTRQVTPERVSKQAHDLVGKFPSPQGVADILHGVGETASQHLDRATKISKPADALQILQDFMQNVPTIVNDIVAKDKAAKKTFGKKGGSFDF